MDIFHCSRKNNPYEFIINFIYCSFCSIWINTSQYRWHIPLWNIPNMLAIKIYCDSIRVYRVVWFWFQYDYCPLVDAIHYLFRIFSKSNTCYGSPYFSISNQFFAFITVYIIII